MVNDYMDEHGAIDPLGSLPDDHSQGMEHLGLKWQRIVVSPEQIQGTTLHLTGEQRHYLGRVLRLGEGDGFIALDGRGGCWLVRWIPQSAQGEVLRSLILAAELLVSVVLVAALPKGTGFDEVVRQATELGVTCIVPVISDRTLLHPSPQKLQRWRRLAQEAAEQTERAWVPTIVEPQSLMAGLDGWRNGWRDGLTGRECQGASQEVGQGVSYGVSQDVGQEVGQGVSQDVSQGISYGASQGTSQGVNEGERNNQGRTDTVTRPHFFCVTRRSAPHLLTCLRSWREGGGMGKNCPVVVAVGPEGGWTEVEVEGAIARGFQPVSLGPRILRTVTAPGVALSLVAAMVEESH